MDVRAGPWRRLNIEELMLLNCGVGEDSWESLLDCKETKPVRTKGNQSWLFIGRADAEAESSNTLAAWCEGLIHWKRPWCWERLKAGGEGDDREWDGWIASPTRRTWVWASSGNWCWRGKPGMLHSWSCRVWHNWENELNTQIMKGTLKLKINNYN